MERRRQIQKWARRVAVLVAALVLVAPVPALAKGAEDVAQAEAVASVGVEVSPDEREIALSASGRGASTAASLAFDIWPEGGDPANAVRHGAVKLADGTWTARVFIAPETPFEPGVPRHCRIERAVHGLYNPYTGQHFFTADVDEADGLSRGGWRYEGVAWIEPEAGTDAPPVYRLYNPWTGDHYFTMSEEEYEELPASGWIPEDVAFSSDPASAQPIYQLFNPYEKIGTHYFTTNPEEVEELASCGWREEDICWYGASVNADASWSLPSGNAPVGEPGSYRVAAVAIAEDGTETPLGETTCSVTSPTASVAIEHVDEASGSFDVVVRDVQSATGVLQVQVPVWSAADQHDIIWYAANPQEDGTYRVTVRAASHGYACAYTAHVYVRCANGLLVHTAEATATLELRDLVYLSGGPNTYTLTIVNPGPASSVKMPVWSEDGGQDDLVWYEATWQGDRWSATINTSNLLHSGHCIAHIYVDGEMRKGFDFNVSAKEVLTRRQRAIIKASEELPSFGYGYCAGWVSTVLANAGYPVRESGNANDMYYRLHLTDPGELLPGMVVAVSTHSRTYAGSRWGHVGIYLGNGTVVDDVGYIRHSALDWWLSWYGDRVPVRFGFLE